MPRKTPKARTKAQSPAVAKPKAGAKTKAESDPNADPVEPAAEWRQLSTLRPWKGNPRNNAGRPVEAVVASLVKFGWGRPLVARAGELVVGHTARLAALSLPDRYEAASKTDRKDWHPEAVRTATTGQVPVRSRDDLSESDAHLLALTDNRLNELAEWDQDALEAARLAEGWEVEDLEVAGWNLDEQVELGWAEFDGDPDAQGGEGSNDDDEVSDPPKDPITKPGDLWELGDHRLLCGDSKLPESFDRLMGDALADLVFTDPPYGVDYAPVNSP